jgi:hypothetical protein
MENQIQNYSVIPDAEKINQPEGDRFIEQTLKGMVDERGYCPLEGGPMGGQGYWDNHFVNQPVKLGEYESIPTTGGFNNYPSNPRFQKLNYALKDGTPKSMIVHIDIVDQNPNLNGLDGLLIKDAILAKIK